MAVKKKKQGAVAGKVQAVVPQGKGKRPEALVQTATGTTEFKRLEESGLPRQDVARRVQEQKQKDFQTQVQTAEQQLQPEQPPLQQPLTPEINPEVTLGDINIPVPQEQKPGFFDKIGIPELAPGFQTPAEQQGIQPQPLPFNINRNVAGAIASPLLASTEVALAAKQSLNVPAQATKIINKLKIPSAKNIIGKAPQAGQLAINGKTTLTLKDIATKVWQNKVATIATIGLVASLIDSSLDDNRYLDTVRALDDQINKISSNMVLEDDPLTQKAYLQERERLITIYEELNDVNAWDQFFSHVPGVKLQVQNKYKNIADDAVQSSQNFQFGVDDAKVDEINRLTAGLGDLPLDVADEIIKRAERKSKLRTGAEELA